MPHQPNSLVPKTNTPRPPLPYAHANPFLSLTDTSKPPAVKYQVITREGQEIVVGRVKIQTPGGGHAFVLRRFDTGAISLTTMFRAAFPSAPEDAEKVESSWVKANFESSGANGSGKDMARLRLAGTWIHADVAKTIAPTYSLDHVIAPLTTAEPDPQQEYRRSTKQNSPQVGANGSPSKAAPRIDIVAPTSPSPSGPNPSKRRKESSPITAAANPPAESLPVPRRSVRTTSPAPAMSQTIVSSTITSATSTTRVSRTKPVKPGRASLKPASGRPSSRLTPAESDYAQGDGEGDIAEVPGPDMHEDIAEQKEMIAKLKAERQASSTATAPPTAQPIQKSESQISKRSRDEEDKPLHFQFREPEPETAVAVRPIASNNRLNLAPQQKSAAWGALWFAAGLAAAATIPSFFM